MPLLGHPVKSPFNSPSGSVIGLNDIPDMSDAVAWYRKGQGITVTGSGVSQWDDQSGEDNHLKQATDTNRPALQSDGTILFDGVDNFLKTDAFTLNQPTTYYYLFKQVTWTDSASLFDGGLTNSNLIYQYTGASSPQIGFFAGVIRASNSDLAVDTYGVVAAVFNSASSSLQVGNNPPVTGNAGTKPASGFTMGVNGNGVSNHGNIQVQEVIIYNVAHNAEQRAAVIRYLARVGGLTL